MDPFATHPGVSASSWVEVPGELNNPPRKTRSACNRCHSQKLRCVRKQGEISCERCLKLYTPCRFGLRAPRASNKPVQRIAGDWQESLSVPVDTPMPNSHLNPVATNKSGNDWLFSPDVYAGVSEEQAIMHPDFSYPMLGDLADMNKLWPDPLCKPGNANSLEQYCSLDIINPEFRDAFPSPETSGDYSRAENDSRLITSPASTVRDFAMLNITLYDCAARLPSILRESVNSAGIASHERSSRERTLFAIDDLFHLTSKFIDAVRNLSCDSCDISATSPAKDSAPVSNDALSLFAQNKLWHGGLETTPSGSERSFPRVDEGTMLLIMSCHSRLTEIYLSVFDMMQACMRYSAAPREKNWGIILPRLQVGSHATPPLQVDSNTPVSSATSSMYMVMITMLSSQLCEKLADMMRLGDGGINCGGEGIYLGWQEDGNHVPPSQDLLKATVTYKTNRLRSTIEATRHLLQRFPNAME